MYNSTPPRYELPWLVRQAKGRWQIKVQGYNSNTATFKIDKRKQIVEGAQSWVGNSRDTILNYYSYFSKFAPLFCGSGLPAESINVQRDFRRAPVSRLPSPVFLNRCLNHLKACPIIRLWKSRS